MRRRYWKPFQPGNVVAGYIIVEVIREATDKGKMRYRAKYRACGHQTEISHKAINRAQKHNRNLGKCLACASQKEVRSMLDKNENHIRSTMIWAAPIGAEKGHIPWGLTRT